MNNWTAIGRITREFDLKYTTSGVAVASTTIAIDRGYGDNKKTDFIPIVAWKAQAENAAKFTKKGSKIAVEGQLTSRTYDNKEGKRVTVIEVMANRIEFLDSKKEEVGKEVAFDADEIPWN